MENTEQSSAPATSSSAAGGKEKIEKQARQLAYDTRYKVKQSMAAKAGSKLDPAAVRKAYLAQLSKSPSSPPVKARAKEMLVGEDYINTNQLVSDSTASIIHKVFVEGIKEESIEEIEEDTKEKTYQVRVTDKKTNNSYVTNKTRDGIRELRANPNISSVEMTGYGSPTKSEKYKGKNTAAVKSGKGDEISGKDTSVDLKKNEEYSSLKSENYDGFLELIEKKGKTKSKKITGEGVNNKNVVKVFPNDIEEQSEPTPSDYNPASDPKKKALQNPKMKRLQQQKVLVLRKKAQLAQQGAQDVTTSYVPELELTEEFITERVDHATEYFYKEGINEDGLDLIIEEVGIDEFTAFVIDGPQELNEDDVAYQKAKKKAITGSNRREREGKGEYSPQSKGSKSPYAKEGLGVKSKKKPKIGHTGTKVVAATKKAKKAQPAKPASKEGLGSKIRGFVSKGVERHKAATKKASGEVKKIAKTASDTAKQHAGHRKKFVSGLKATPKEKKIAGGIAKGAKKALTGEEFTNPDMDLLDIVNSITEKKVYKGNPKGSPKKPEGGDRRPGVKEDAALEVQPKKKEEVEDDYRSMWTKANLVRNKLRAMGLKMSHEPEGEIVDEVYRSAAENNKRYDRARKAAARRAAERNRQRDAGELNDGRRERETYTSSSGTRMHHKGYKAREGE